MSLMARPNQQGQVAPQDDFPWYMKYGARVLGIIGAGCKSTWTYNFLWEFYRPIYCIRLRKTVSRPFNGTAEGMGGQMLSSFKG